MRRDDIALSEEVLRLIHALYAQREAEVFAGINEATLNVPQEQAYRTGGKRTAYRTPWTHAGRNAVSQCLARSAMVTEDGYATSGHHCTATVHEIWGYWIGPGNRC